jgi:hypothetical protein
LVFAMIVARVLSRACPQTRHLLSQEVRIEHALATCARLHCSSTTGPPPISRDDTAHAPNWATARQPDGQSSGGTAVRWQGRSTPATHPTPRPDPTR